MDNRVLELYQKRSSNLRFLNPPKHTDSTEMKESRLGLTESQLLKRAKLLSMTGRAVYKKRIGQDEELAILRQLPKGYYVRFDEQDRMTVHGHPSGRCYKNPSSFIPHILWLEDYKSKNQPSIRACECSLCKQYGAPSKEVTEKLMKKQKSKSANDQLSEHLNVKNEEHNEPQRLYKCYKIAKVGIEPPLGLVQYPKSVKIPLPKILQPDINLLLSSHREKEKDTAH